MTCTNATAVLGELGMAGLVAVLKQCHEAALRDAVPESLGGSASPEMWYFQ